MSRCCECRSVIDEGELFLTCSQCEFSYHSGTCSGVAESAIKGKRDQFKKSWKCESCKPTGSKSSSSAKACKNENEIIKKLAEMDQKLNLLVSLPNKVEGIEQSIETLSDHFDEIQRRLESHEKELNTVKRKVENIEKYDSPRELGQIQIDIDALEWHSRRLNIEIHGVPEADGENLREKVNELAQKLELQPLSEEDVVAVHRLPAKQGKTRGIIVRLARQERRDAWIAKRRTLMDSQSNIFINENLTSRSRKLLATAKEWAKEAGYKFVWHSNGKVLVRRANGESANVVKDENDLRALLE